MILTMVIGFGLVTIIDSNAEFFNDPNTLDIASFNLKVFGVKKMKDKTVRDTLIKIVRRYDLILIQEIRDSKGKSIIELVNMINKQQEQAGEEKYKVEVSTRLGRTSSKEQYAAIYRPDWVTLVDKYVYRDTEDVFEREPHIIRFTSPRSSISDFVVVNIHTKPEDAQKEVAHLVDVYDDVVKRLGVKDVFIMGDFNADCDYIPDWGSVSLATDKRFYWLIDDALDTTVFSTDCTYDRVVVAGEKLIEAVIPYSPSVLYFDKDMGYTQNQAVKVSDHYPVHFQIRSKEEKDNIRTSSTYKVTDKSIARSLKGNYRQIYALRNAVKDVADFKLDAFYTSSGAYSVIILSKKNMSKLSSVLSALYELAKTFPGFVTSSQMYTVKRLLRETDPLLRLRRGYGRYQTLYDYYKTKDRTYAVGLECVLSKNRENPDCWINFSTAFPK